MAEKNKAPIQQTVAAKPAPVKAEVEQTVPAKKGMTPEVKAKLAARVEAKKVARERVRTFLLENADQLGGLKVDIELFIGSGSRARGEREPTIAPTSALRTALLEAGDKGLSEMDIFKMFKIGRPEMNIKRRVLVQSAKKPEDRVWISFDKEAETWNVVGKGAKAPEGWDGWLPGDDL